jgi:hypothetical protein
MLIKIKVQVILIKNLLATWIPSYLAQKIINLDKRSIVSIDTRTFMGLSHITNLSLSDNSIKIIDLLQFND